ncbi:MAG: hypothetical protein GEU88_19920 [Solirubrobacterales bacterium]|nr:hypothetical protein [Solirubrobacterales bacterium]
MERLRYLNPFLIRRAVGDIRRVLGGGGPRLVRLVSIGHPRGWIIPSSTVTIEVEARDGNTARFAPEIPVPFPYAWTYRIARRLGVPLIRDVEPESVGFEVGAPGHGATAPSAERPDR